MGTFKSSPLSGAVEREKYALVIGNSAYQKIGKLKNALKDTRDVAAALKRLNWKVALCLDLNYNDFLQVLDAHFAKLKAKNDCEGFLWFSGHGVKISGGNYLLPVDVNAKSEDAVKSYSFPLHDILWKLENAGNKMNVVIIDACRNNPFPSCLRGTGRGLAASQCVPHNLFLMFSASPGAASQDGNKDGNSPFAAAFLKYVNSKEPLVMMSADVENEMVSRTGAAQRPLACWSVMSDKWYSLNPREEAAPASEDMLMVFVRGGSFMMGSPESETGRDEEEVCHRVAVNSFYIGKYEVTQSEYQEVMGSNPSIFRGDNLPVESVSWFDAVKYCNAASRREGLTLAYRISGDNVTWNKSANGYRLPTEAEWEYACRAGTTSPYSSGDFVDDAGWYGGNSGGKTHPVGQKAANAWGLYDMHGNVWEWCWDWYGSYSRGAQSNPTGAASGTGYVCRGGSWSFHARFLRSAYRIPFAPSFRSNILGFRVVRSYLDKR